MTVGTPGTVHVASIGLAFDYGGANNCRARAFAVVVDASGATFGGAAVTGDWDYNGETIATNASADTDVAGSAMIFSPWQRAKSGKVFTFTVTGIVADGYVYDPGGNLETHDSVAVA